MVKIGIYLPVYGGWLPSRESAKAVADGSYFDREEEERPSYSYVKEVALKAEKIGVDSVWIPDHMLNPIKGGHAPALEAWTVAVAIAEATEKVIIAHTTLCEAFRPPAVLAKMAATLDDVSNHRFWLSIGAGWYKREYEAYGLPFYEHDERVRRAGEAIEIIRRLWRENGITFKGKYYQIINGVLEPKPKKIPLWYAGVSEASRNLVAEKADGWLMRGCSVEEARKNIEDMKKRLKKAGRDEEEMEFAIPALTFIRDTDEEALNHMEKLTGGRRNVLDRTLDTGLVGSPETVAEKIRKFEEAGIDHILLQLTPTLKEVDNVQRVLEFLR
ncbi:Coenzyme F420-dependent N5,N10-methylene tetrahydromethanopterin reductase-related flavin-dependent oxidoreductase [Archaeoglobus sulfaticallidus PM70-1]|uniref:Coenzyme F420-dependent N5,N10-methylene tetrahydromethanopterin reductase-related flavin-dependent oxidoreductase n=1 Tax=Archaeoglobus sulfaticallidus PM70-1 TaxID=387631 RepID=N0BGJ0_9EURY|nr:LLM class flavin-dependent oxidoreductase [Archaeoglobus sulfaticallidus]AGK61407.1 Coenzyme F420-dependent N5,N10-methylene tetrahydromethanopterin reductase-related flavin-dependent oxidoreductase [Archaeoglobus sulfaticallidus PM70-1]